MSEIIKEIQDLDHFELVRTLPQNPAWWWEGKDTGAPMPKTYEDRTFLEGFKILTDAQEIVIGISNQSGCCESWGHIRSEENLKDFEGAELIGITAVDLALKTVEVPDLYDGGAIFVNVETNRGTLQFVLYNSHNGYYGHNVIVQSTQLNMETLI